MQPQRDAALPKKLEKERKSVGCSIHCLVTLVHTNFARGREKREKENAVSIMKKSSGSSFQNLQGTVNFVSSRSGVLLLLEERERKHNCASPSDDNLFYDWGVVFFFVFFFVCALFRSRLFAFARKQRKR